MRRVKILQLCLNQVSIIFVLRSKICIYSSDMVGLLLLFVLNCDTEELPRVYKSSSPHNVGAEGKITNVEHDGKQKKAITKTRLFKYIENFTSKN